MNKKIYQQHSLHISQRIHGSHLFIVAYFYEAPTDGVAALEFLDKYLVELLREQKAIVVHERCFGSADALKAMTSCQIAAQDKTTTQLHSCITPIDGMPCHGTPEKTCSGFSGLQIEAITPNTHTSAPEPIFENEACVGHKWKEQGGTFFLLQNLCARDCSLPNTLQTTQTLQRAETLLKMQCVDYHAVGRTWIYLDDILAWYTPFNEARSAFYRTVGIMPDIEKQAATPAGECYLPASTGIRGRNLNGAACTIDLIAADLPSHAGIVVRRLTNRKQKDAFRYGAAFARASVTETEEYAEVQISGTASIDETGASTFLGNAEAQIRNTLDTIETLIGEADFTLTDICSATAFLKHEADLPLFLRILEERGLTDLPVVICKADVCRDDLLFEMDGIAGKAR